MDRATVRQQVAELARQYTDEALPQIPEIIALARRLATDGPHTETQGAGRFDASFCPHCHEKLNESLQVACRIWRWESPELAAGGDDGIMVEVREGLGLFNIDILEVKNGWAEAAFEFPNIQPWSAETPRLYTLLCEVKGQAEAVRIGFRRVEIIGEELFVNGRSIKVFGVNRHDTHTTLGQAMPLETLREDALIMKRSNMNIVRTAHYPSDPRFLDICDELGLYVVDEADIESHGVVRVVNACCRALSDLHGGLPKLNDSIDGESLRMIRWRGDS